MTLAIRTGWHDILVRCLRFIERLGGDPLDGHRCCSWESSSALGCLLSSPARTGAPRSRTKRPHQRAAQAANSAWKRQLRRDRTVSNSRRWSPLLPRGWHSIMNLSTRLASREGSGPTGPTSRFYIPVNRPLEKSYWPAIQLFRANASLPSSKPLVFWDSTALAWFSRRCAAQGRRASGKARPELPQLGCRLVERPRPEVGSSRFGHRTYRTALSFPSVWLRRVAQAFPSFSSLAPPSKATSRCRSHRG
jgi:hypothetical protein